MGFFSRDKGSKGSKETKFGGGWDKDKKAAKDKVDRDAKKLEEQRGTHGRGTKK